MPTRLDNYNCLIETGLVLTKKLYVQGQWYLMLKLKSSLRNMETTEPVVPNVNVEAITSNKKTTRPVVHYVKVEVVTSEVA